MPRTFIDEQNDRDMIDGILQPGGHFRMPMFLRDGITPNPKLTDAQRAQIAIAATRDAMTTQDTMASHRPGFRYSSSTGTNDAAAKRDAAYNDYDREITDAWRDKQFLTYSGPDAKSPPSGAYAQGNGCSAGDSCTINGSPGELQAIPGHNGWLRCVADDDDTDYSGDNDDTNDSRTQYDAASSEKIKTAAYSKYDSDLRDAWRNK